MSVICNGMVLHLLGWSYFYIKGYYKNRNGSMPKKENVQDDRDAKDEIRRVIQQNDACVSFQVL